MSVDILGTSWDQCRSMVQYSFTSTETRRIVRTDSPGRPPRLSHSSWTMIDRRLGEPLVGFSTPDLAGGDRVMCKLAGRRTKWSVYIPSRQFSSSSDTRRLLVFHVRWTVTVTSGRKPCTNWQLVSWRFEPSQLHRVILGLKWQTKRIQCRAVSTSLRWIFKKRAWKS